MRRMMLSALLVAGLPAAGHAQIGKPLPRVDLTSFAKTEAQSLQDFQGRLLLLEFFAYW